MPSAAVEAITVLWMYAAWLGLLGEPMVGVGAYYHQADMRQVCRYRVAEGWQPNLDCDWPCLAASMRAGEIGEYVLADLPGHSFVV